MKKNAMFHVPQWMLLIAFSISLSTCKKASTYPVNLCGEWIDPHGYDAGSCTLMYISLMRNDRTTYGTLDEEKGCDQKKWKGKAKYTNEHLFIGTIKYTFIDKPALYTGTDSVTVYGKTYKILATMTLQNSFFHHKDTYTYVKYLDY